MYDIREYEENSRKGRLIARFMHEKEAKFFAEHLLCRRAAELTNYEFQPAPNAVFYSGGTSLCPAEMFISLPKGGETRLRLEFVNQKGL